jgi:alkanesulfonate monooxygenase SsuD/methylene tetrahydromethanopterin reductase-like flavin-dependent oxidoreductase (luciferase family)
VLGQPASTRAELDGFLSTYYNAPAEVMRKRQACYAGEPDACVDWMRRFIEAGARHIVVRFAGRADHLTQLERLAGEVLPRVGALG